MTTPATVTIDRLTLSVPGSDAEHGRRLAQLVAERLAPGLLAGLGGGAVDRLRIEVGAAPGVGDESLAEQIAAELLRALEERSLGAVR